MTAPDNEIEDRLTTVLRLLAKEILEKLPDAAPDPVFSEYVPKSSEWTRHDQRMFMRHPREGWLRPLEALTGMHALPSYMAFVDLIQSHTLLGRHLDDLVGTPKHRQRLDPWSIVMSAIVDPMVSASRSYEFDDESFSSYASRLVKDLLATEFVSTSIIPLRDFMGPEEAVELGDGAVLRVLEDDEIGACLSLNAIPSGGLHPFHQVEREDQWALVYAFPVPKVIGSEPEAPMFYDPPITDHARRFTTAARLLFGGDVIPGPWISFGARSLLFPGTSMSWGPARPIGGRRNARPTLLGGPGIGRTMEFSAKLRSSGVSSNRSLMLALRRFDDAALRENHDDRLIDLFIAAEALFLPGERQELAHQLSLRAAAFVDIELHSRSQVMRFMKRAYGARSRLVHGENLGTLRALDGSETTLRNLLTQVEPIIASALVKAVEARASGEEIDWVHLIDQIIDESAAQK